MLYPIGIQDFEKLRRGGFAYVDKTRFVYELVSTGSYYFLGRPRRFGKSLLLTTMEYYFLGEKDLFKGLALEELEKDWTAYPVLHLDLNTGKYSNEDSLLKVLDDALNDWERLYGKNDNDDTPALRFKNVIQRAYEQTGRQVVILVDEYDKPLLQNFNRPELQDELRAELKAFYSVLKTQDKYIRFAFLTGVTKFGKVSVFSDLNNLKDISMDKRYAEICGITEAEIHQYFETSLHRLAEENEMTYEEVCGELKRRYDGYHFRAGGGPGVYNPFSLLNTLDSQEFGDYWFETGTPSFLVELLQGCSYDLSKLEECEVESSVLVSTDSVRVNPLPLIYQSGYLTIHGYNKEFRKYRLGFPNKEVEDGFMRFLLPYYIRKESGGTGFSVQDFVEEVRGGNAAGFMSRLQALFEGMDYRIMGDMELYFQNALFLIFKLMGIYTDVEYVSARGRADIVLQTRGFVYIIECKLDGTVDEALRQIEERGYGARFVHDVRKVFRIGVSFSSERRVMAEWRIG